MQQSSSSDQALAHWQFSTEEWKSFVNPELKRQMKTYKSLKNGSIGIIVVAVVIMILLVLIPYLMLKPWQTMWRKDVWGPILGVVSVAGTLLFFVGMFRLIVWNNISRLNLPSGDVVITITGVGLNGVWLTWGFENSGWKFHGVRRKTIPSDNDKSIEILEFKTSAIHHGDIRNAKGKVRTLQVPIPTGREAEADQIIEILYTKKDQSAIKSDS